MRTRWQYWMALVLVCGVWAGSAIPLTSEIAVHNTTMLNAHSVDETASTAIGAAFMPRCRESAAYVVWGTGVTAGVVEVETAHDGAYTGTWAPLATVTFSGTAPKSDVVQVTGIHLALRTRISTVISGGTVSTYFVCN